MAQGGDTLSRGGAKEGQLERWKIWASGFLELGFHNDGSDSFTLGRPDPRKLETESFAFDPSHQGFVDAQRPLLVVKEQGQAEHHANLHLGKGRRLTAVRGEIADRRLALEVILSKKEETATQAETAAPTFRHRGFVVRA